MSQGLLWDVKHQGVAATQNSSPWNFAVGAHLEVHGGKQGTKCSEPIQSLYHWAIYSGNTRPINARCVEKPLTPRLSTPSLALTHFGPVDVLPMYTGHPQAPFFPHPESDINSRYMMYVLAE